MPAAWFVGVTKPQHEFIAARSLRDAGFGEVYVPCSRHWVRSKFKLLRRQKTTTPLFRGYLFLRFEREAGRWHDRIHNAVGMRTLLRDVDGIPQAVSDAVIETLQQAERNGEFDTTLKRTRFRPGDVVEIQDGPLAGLIGRIRAANGSDRVQLLVGALTVAVGADKLAVRPHL